MADEAIPGQDAALPHEGMDPSELEELRREQDLLWSLVALAERCPSHPCQGRLDALLAGRPLGAGRCPSGEPTAPEAPEG